MTSEVEALLEEWRPSDRKLLGELLEDARTELQREMIHRVVVARHACAEVHAFADTIRALDDEALYQQCTIDPRRTDVPVTARFRAEADPLYAMELNGHLLPPSDDDPGPVYGVVPRARPAFRAPPALLLPPEPPRVGAPPKPSFDSESSSARARPLATHLELGASGEDVPSVRRSPTARASGADAGANVEALNEALRGLGLSFRDHEVDTRELPLEHALELAAQALQNGIPVPVTLGREKGDRGRQVLMLQVTPPGRTRAFQLHDPFAHETVWAHEKDLLSRAELPFDHKQWRRITAIALPNHPKRR
ncbi:MAG: hypothetical protein IRZ16_08175 [Myxococcaceae bacterium]|nr:hypothetical protein [Myxococcaceae bacterium]